MWRSCWSTWQLAWRCGGGGAQQIVAHVLQLPRAHRLIEVPLRQQIAEQRERHRRNLDARDVNVRGIDAPLRLAGRPTDRPRWPLFFSLDDIQDLIERVDHPAQTIDRPE